MTEIHLRLHGDRFALRGPAAAIGAVDVLYHPSVIDTDPAPGEPAATAFEIERVGAEWRLTEEASSETLGAFAEPILALLKLEHEIELRLLARLDGEVAFHAGAVVTPAGACLLAGKADTGKSSTTLQLLELGHAFLAEEIAAVDDEGLVQPHLQSLAIDPKVVAELERGQPIRHGRIEVIAELLHRYVPARVAAEPAPLATIVLPVFGRNVEPGVEELSVDAVLTDLLGFCFEPAGDPETSIERVIELASRARLVRLHYPDAAMAKRLLTGLFDGRSA